MAVQRIFREENVSMACLIFSGGIFSYLYSCDSIISQYYMEFTQKRRNNAPVPVRNLIKFRFESVFEDLKISKYKKESYDLFIADDLDPITLGSTKVRQGVKIGVPEYFQKSSTDDIRTTIDKIRGKSVNLSTDNGERLLQALQLSERAQKFALAKAYDKISDEQALDVSQEYLLGGLEYYEKMVERNKTLRNLMRNGEKYFDENGDDTSFLRPLGLPTSLKVELVKERIKEFQFKEELFTPPPVNPNPHPIR